MDNNALYLRNPDVVLREEDEDGGLLFNPDLNIVKVVNHTGIFIWKICDGQHEINSIVSEIEKNFEDVPAGQIHEDVKEFLTEMTRSGFIGTISG